MKQNQLLTAAITMVIFQTICFVSCTLPPPPPTKLEPDRSVMNGLPYYGPPIRPQGKVGPKLPVIYPPIPSLLDFGAVLIMTSAKKDFTVWGQNLTALISITPPPGFTVVPNTITPVGGFVPPTPIHVTFKPTEVKTYSGNIAISSAGGITQNVAVTGRACPDIFFEPVGDLPGDCYFTYCTDISRDGERVTLNSFSKEPAWPASGGACEPTSSGFTYQHPYQAGGWTSPCKDIRFFPASTTSGLIGLGYVAGGIHLETTAQGVSPEGAVVVGYTSYGSGFPDSTIGTVISSMGTQTLNFLPGDNSSVAQDVSESSPIALPFLPPSAPKRIIVGYSYRRIHEPSIDSFAHAVYWHYVNNGFSKLINALPIPLLLPNNEKVVSSEALCVSDDGLVIGGNLYYSEKSDGTHFNAQPCIWRRGISSYNYELLDDLDNTELNARVLHISGDGKWIVGYATLVNGTPTACRWNINVPSSYTPDPLPFLSGTTISGAQGVNQDGSVIVGNNANKTIIGQEEVYSGYATIWKSTTIGGPMTVYNITQILNSNGIPLPPDWSLIVTTRVSANGKFITGYANRPDPLSTLLPSDPDYAPTIEGWVIGLPPF